MMQEFIVDLAGVHDAETLHDALAAQLPLPDYYGRNLDAFYDVLTEFGCDWRIVFRNAGPAVDGLREVCHDAAEETEGLEIAFETEQRKDATMDNEVLKALRGRRSVRAYKPEQIKDEELKTVLEAGTYAPTGMGWQDPWIVAVQDPEIIAQLVRMNAKAMGTTGNPYYGAPTIVLVFASPVEKVPFSAAVPKKLAMEGSMITFESQKCGHIGCPNHRFCCPPNIGDGDKRTITDVVENLDCPVGENMVRVKME